MGKDNDKNNDKNQNWLGGTPDMNNVWCYNYSIIGYYLNNSIKFLKN